MLQEVIEVTVNYSKLHKLQEVTGKYTTLKNLQTLQEVIEVADVT